jgi:hypothetical protein
MKIKGLSRKTQGIDGPTDIYFGDYQVTKETDHELAAEIVKRVNAYDDLRDSLAYIESSAPITEGTTLEPHETVEIIVTVAGLAKLRAVLASLASLDA